MGIPDPREDANRRMALQYELTARAFREPDFSATRATATPQEAYAAYQASCPVRDLGDGMYSLLAKQDILYVTKHHDVASARDAPRQRPSGHPARPRRRGAPQVPPPDRPDLHRQAGRAARRQCSRARRRDDRRLRRPTATVDAYTAWCEPLPSTVFLSIMGLPMDDLDKFLHFKRPHARQDPDGASLSMEERVARRDEAVVWIQRVLQPRPGRPRARARTP